jgi:serine/threonine protein kinase
MDSAQNIKIGDFGLAKELGSESKFATTNVGTPFYMSPEMINEQKYNEKSDIWALGCLLYELCALVPPFDAHNHLSLAVKINAGKFDRIPAVYSEDLHRAIRWMLSLEVRLGSTNIISDNIFSCGCLPFFLCSLSSALLLKNWRRSRKCVPSQRSLLWW